MLRSSRKVGVWRRMSVAEDWAESPLIWVTPTRGTSTRVNRLPDLSKFDGSPSGLTQAVSHSSKEHEHLKNLRVCSAAPDHSPLNGIRRKQNRSKYDSLITAHGNTHIKTYMCVLRQVSTFQQSITT